MTNDLENQLQSLATQLEQTIRLFPDAVAEMRSRDPDAAALLEDAFGEIRGHFVNVQAEFAEFARDFDERVKEARQSAEELQSWSPTTGDNAPASQVDVPRDVLAAELGADLLDRYAPSRPAAKEPNISGSSVWFDFSSHGSEAGASSNELEEALTILASLTRRCAVWWTCVAMSEAISNVWNTLTANDRNAVESAVAWVINPEHSRLQSAMRLAAQEPPGSLARALGELFHAIGTADPQSVAERGVAEAAMAVLRQSCVRLDIASAANVLRHARAIAVDVKAGRRLWQGHPPEASVNVVGSLATFSRWMSNE